MASDGKILQEDGSGLLLEDGSGYLVKEEELIVGRDNFQPQRTNETWWSEALSNPPWNLLSMSITSDAIAAPDTTITADLITITSTGADAIDYQNTAGPVAGTDSWTASVYAKKSVGDWVTLRPWQGGNIGNAYFNINTGTLGSKAAWMTNQTITDVGGGWYRISVTLPGFDTAYRFHAFGIVDADGSTTCTAGKAAYFWGAQLEVGDTISPYIPTASAAVTRAAGGGMGAAAATIVGTGSLPAIGTGTLAAQAAVVASVTGISRSLITDTSLNVDPAVVASTTGISRSLITDTTLVADAAVVVSTTGVSRSLITDTTIDAGVVAVASTTGIVRSINTANTLTAQAAVVASTTGLSRSIAPSSALAPQRSTVVGVGAGAVITGAGVLNVLPATAVGAGLSAVTGAGALQALAANSNGPGLSQFIGTGALFAEWADIAGLGAIPFSPFVSGPYTQVGDLWEGAAVWGKIDGKWRRMRLWSRSAAAWGMVAWDKDAQEVDVISEPAYGVLDARGAHIAGAGFIRDQFWGTGDLRAGPALVTDSSSLSGLSVITNAAWEVTPLWVKANGKWRRATMWTNVSAEWKRVA